MFDEDFRQKVASYRGIGLGSENAYASEVSVHFKLGEKLMQAGLITRDQLEKALNEQRKSGGLLGANLIKLGFIKEKELLTFLKQQYGLAPKASNPAS